MQREGRSQTQPSREVLPEPQMFFNSAKEKSRIAQLRVERVLRTWRNRSVTQTNLKAGNVPLGGRATL